MERDICFLCDGLNKGPGLLGSRRYTDELIKIFNAYQYIVPKIDEDRQMEMIENGFKGYNFLDNEENGIGDPALILCEYCIDFSYFDFRSYGFDSTTLGDKVKKINDFAFTDKFFKVESKGKVGGFFSSEILLHIKPNLNIIKKIKDDFKKSVTEQIKSENKIIEGEEQKKNNVKKSIISLLTKKSIKITISDITAHIKHDNRYYVKSVLEEMHKEEDVDFAGNGRYFILSKEKKKHKAKEDFTSQPDEVDVEKELKKIKSLLDKDLITQEQYDAKSNEILGL